MSEKRFRFRLASVLRVAEVRKKQSQQDLLVQSARAARAEKTAQERQAAYEALPAPPPSDAAAFHQQRQVADLRARAVQEAVAARARAEGSMLEAREAWLDASRRARSLERLEERHIAAHAMVAARAAQRALDDLVRIRRGEVQA